MSADIFISYRGADRVLARKLEYRLRSRWGSRVFRDETGVTSGRNWAKELTDAMKGRAGHHRACRSGLAHLIGSAGRGLGSQRIGDGRARCQADSARVGW